MKIYLGTSLAFLLLCVCHHRSLAQQIVTDRPDQTEASSTIPKGSFQIESGILVQHAEDAGIKSRDIALPTTLFRYGIVKWLEARVVVNYNLQQLNIGDTSISNTSGIPDLQLGTKIQLFRKDSSSTEVALLAHAVVPSGSSAFTIGQAGVITKLAISHSLHDKVGLGYNVGYDYLGTGKGDLIYSLSFAFSLTDKLGAFLEPYGSWDNFSASTVNFDGGFVYLIKDNLQFDFSIGTGLNHRMNFVSTGISWNISR